MVVSLYLCIGVPCSLAFGALSLADKCLSCSAPFTFSMLAGEHPQHDQRCAPPLVPSHCDHIHHPTPLAPTHTRPVQYNTAPTSHCPCTRRSHLFGLSLRARAPCPARPRSSSRSQCSSPQPRSAASISYRSKNAKCVLPSPLRPLRCTPRLTDARRPPRQCSKA